MPQALFYRCPRLYFDELSISMATFSQDTRYIKVHDVRTPGTVEIRIRINWKWYHITDCICHDLLIAKLNAYGFDRNAVRFISDHLSDRSKKIKVGSSFSAYLDIIMYRRDLYLGLCCLTQIILICIFRSTVLTSQFLLMAPPPYEYGPTLNEVMNNLEITTEKIFEWFSFNNLKWKQMLLNFICLFLLINLFQ